MKLTRRELLAGTSVAALRAQSRLDRRAIVDRHSPILRKLDEYAPLTVGNGEFAFTVDATGLQTFPALYEKSIPLCTQSQWGWHSDPIPSGFSAGDLQLEKFDTYGRQVGYATNGGRGQERLFKWLRENPHRLNLARIGLDVRDASQFAMEEQKLDLWTGTIVSRFRWQGKPVTVWTCCHPELDAIAIRMESDALAVMIEFPFASSAMNASQWDAPDRHRTSLASRNATSLQLDRQMDSDRYTVDLAFGTGTRAEFDGRHRVTVKGVVEFTCLFAARRSAPAPAPREVFAASERHWRRFWSTGAALDLSGSTDSRAQELERRIVLSQYLTAIQCAGSLPPQETGLTCNSWYGKFHLEMHWWHAAHFVAWGRTSLLERSMPWYSRILPEAREKARRQGYSGARWPKMTGPMGRDTPSAVGELLIWQQPHPILYAEAIYGARPTRATLLRYRDLVFDSAEFMASFAVERDGRFILGPPVIPAQENHPPRETWNPTFELAYWKEALGIAQKWRVRLGMPAQSQWEEVRRKLSHPPAKDGVYLAHENCPQTFTERNRDHPSMLYALGMLNGEGIDGETMRRTLRKVLAEWKWEDTWGWDFPSVAMTASRLGEAELAIDSLFIESPKNRWLPNGHNWQRANLPVYLPGNGALLSAVAMMRFPRHGWRASREGFQLADTRSVR